MSTELKRFSISVSPDLEKMLDEAKQTTYYNQSQTDMIRDLIEKGLTSLAHVSRAKESA